MQAGPIVLNKCMTVSSLDIHLQSSSPPYAFVASILQINRGGQSFSVFVSGYLLPTALSSLSLSSSSATSIVLFMIGKVPITLSSSSVQVTLSFPSSGSPVVSSAMMKGYLHGFFRFRSLMCPPFLPYRLRIFWLLFELFVACVSSVFISYQLPSLLCFPFSSVSSPSTRLSLTPPSICFLCLPPLLILSLLM